MILFVIVSPDIISVRISFQIMMMTIMIIEYSLPTINLIYAD